MDDDAICLDAFKKLRESKLLLKEDVRKYQLLFLSCHPSSKERFYYLVDWDPEALKTTLFRGNPLIHFSVIYNWGAIESFAMILKAGMKHYPEHLGFLFRKNTDGITACEAAFHDYGKDETLKIIQECIPADSKYPILHRVIKNAPQYMDDFAKRYSSAVYLRDENQRLLLHVALSSGTNMDNDAMYISSRRDEEIAERDPITELYPFAIAASAETPDLFTIYHLLRRNPSLLGGTDTSKKRKKRKRK